MSAEVLARWTEQIATLADDVQEGPMSREEREHLYARLLALADETHRAWVEEVRRGTP